LVNRIDHVRREGDQRAERAAMRGGDEYVHDGDAVSHPAVSAVNQRPPEERGGQEEAGMLQRVDEVTSQRRLIPRRQLPDPERDRMEDRGDEGPREPMP